MTKLDKGFGNQYPACNRDLTLEKYKHIKYTNNKFQKYASTLIEFGVHGAIIAFGINVDSNTLASSTSKKSDKYLKIY